MFPFVERRRSQPPKNMRKTIVGGPSSPFCSFSNVFTLILVSVNYSFRPAWHREAVKVHQLSVSHHPTINHVEAHSKGKIGERSRISGYVPAFVLDVFDSWTCCSWYSKFPSALPITKKKKVPSFEICFRK